MAHSRSIARQAAMQLLYERLAGGDADDESLELIYEQLSQLQEAVTVSRQALSDANATLYRIAPGLEK